MSQKPISELRRRMLEDMVVRRLGEKTKSDYVRHVENFTAFLGRSPDARPLPLRRETHMTTTSTITPELLDQLLANYKKPEDLTGEDGLFNNAGLRWRRAVEWTAAMGQFAIQFGERFPGTGR